MKQIADLVRLEHRGSLLAALVLGAAVIAVACETSSTITAGPDPVKCQVSLGAMPMVEAAGGTGTLAVTTQPECTWAASTTANWISGLSPASGQGAGNVSFRVAPNEGTSSRDGTVVVNGQQVVVSQRASCRYTLTPANQNVSANGGDGSITVATADECAWTASTDVSWITLTPPLGGSGDGTVSFAVAANPGAARSGGVIVAGQRSTVTQAAVTPTPSPTCTAAITPTSQNIGAPGGPGTPISVTAPATCQWAAASNVPWITVMSGSPNSGSGTVTFAVAANTGPARTGTLTIAGQASTVTQAAGSSPPPACTYSISAGAQTVPAPGGTGTVGVTAGGGCTWAATSNAPWITITSGATGTGNGSVAFTVAANTGAARTGTLTIAGQTFTVNQEAFVAPPTCTYSISPNNQNVDANASAGAVSVTAGSGCAWTAASNAPWITITAGATGSGNGSVAFSVAANTGAARTGTATIAGQAFTVTQAAAAPPPPPCTYSITPSSQNFTVLGGSGAVSVTAVGSSCSWTAASGAAWITVTSGSSGNGNGSVTFAVAPNLGAARAGTITIAGQAFTVTQDAVLGGVR